MHSRLRKRTSLPLLPPEITQPFSSDHERYEVAARLRKRDNTLRMIERLADKPDALWSGEERQAFPSSISGYIEPPIERIRRWRNIFFEELSMLHRRVDQSLPYEDVELREADYMAARLLSTVSGLRIEDIDQFPVQLISTAPG